MSTLDINELIWQVVARIPPGKVATYGQVAALAGYPRHARYVGSTLKKLPTGTSLPWHRVINAKGQLSFPTGSKHYKKQRALLLAEGVILINMKVSLRDFAWNAK